MGVWLWIAALFVMLVAAGFLVWRRALAEMHSILLGGTLGPGCVIAEAVAMLLLALFLVAAHFAGWLGL